MQVRKLTLKEDRTKVVFWMRKGAPLAEGVRLYASLDPDIDFMRELKKNPDLNRYKLYRVFCDMLGISFHKFETIVNQHYAKEQETKPVAPRSEKREPKTEERTAKRSFRQDWPFLSKADCPTELKALAADKISCWERYTDAHKRLFNCSTIENCYQTAFEVVENYKENRLIHEELDYYGKHGAVLGKHRIFDRMKQFEKLRGLNVMELVSLYKNTLPHRIWRIESEMKKNDKPHLKGEREKRLDEAKSELAEVKRLLMIND